MPKYTVAVDDTQLARHLVNVSELYGAVPGSSGALEARIHFGETLRMFVREYADINEKGMEDLIGLDDNFPLTLDALLESYEYMLACWKRFKANALPSPPRPPEEVE